MAYLIFYSCLLILETIWFYWWLCDKMQIDEMVISEAVQNIVQPYNEKRLSRCKAMIDYIDTKV